MGMEQFEIWEINPETTSYWVTAKLIRKTVCLNSTSLAVYNEVHICHYMLKRSKDLSTAVNWTGRQDAQMATDQLYQVTCTLREQKATHMFPKTLPTVTGNETIVNKLPGPRSKNK